MSSKIAQDVYTRSMKASVVTLSPEELFALSPEVRNRLREAITPRRIQAGETAMSTNVFIDHNPVNPSFEDCPDCIVIPDPYEIYLKTLQPGEIPEPLIVAKESHALRSIMMVVDNKEEIESIVDPGSQIIAMSEEVCHDLGLIYDPGIRLNMQSANGDIDQSLSLSRNVPCRIGTVTLYLQIHVIRAAAYDILLGRPFDVLTESTVKNFANEDQTITITDPNSKRNATIPTISRGPPRHRRCEKHQMGFCF